MPTLTTKKFCKCIKALAKMKYKEASAVAICIKTVLQKKRGITLKKFTCGKKGKVITQRIRR